ncbi:MAG: helical backbone metal receptor [Bdellovibrionales bacterium]|nr:helical backbone metal receptor [Bdellovibrionales bacterium]
MKKLISLGRLLVFSVLVGFPMAGNAASEAPSVFRIVSLNPSLTRLLIDLNLQSSVVGVVSVPGTPLADELPKSVKDVGSYVKPMIEKIIELKPTHVLMIREGEDRISSQLQKAKNTKILILEGRHIDDFLPLLQRIGQEFSKDPKELQVLIQRWNQDWKDVVRESPAAESKRALLMLQVDPVYAAGEDTFLGEILARCGIKNAYGGKGYPRMGREQLEIMPVDLIVYFSMLGQAKEEAAVKKFWSHSVKHKTKPLILETNPQMAQLSLALPRLAKSFCQKLWLQ